MTDLDPTHPDAIPACWSWPVPPERTCDEWIAAKLAEQEGKPADQRYNRADLEFILAGDSTNGRWDEFHQDRCAICGWKRPPWDHLVDDHCHATGQIRGRLCRGCNVREGASSDAIIVRYRRIHPAAILDSHEMYSGRGWEFGWTGHNLRRAYELGIRPATPWPAWKRDDPIGRQRLEQ